MAWAPGSLSRSAQKCYLCLRNELLPMCPERTLILLVDRAGGSNPRPPDYEPGHHPIGRSWRGSLAVHRPYRARDDALAVPLLLPEGLTYWCARGKACQAQPSRRVRIRTSSRCSRRERRSRVAGGAVMRSTRRARSRAPAGETTSTLTQRADGDGRRRTTPPDSL